MPVQTWLEGFIQIHGALCPYCGDTRPPTPEHICQGCRGEWALSLQVDEGFRFTWGLLIVLATAMASLGVLLDVELIVETLSRGAPDAHRLTLMALGPVMTVLAALLLVRRRIFLKSTQPYRIVVLLLSVGLIAAALFSARILHGIYWF